MSGASYTGWAIVEINGYRKLVGLVSEVTMLGVAMLRVEVLGESFDGPRHVHHYPPSSLFGLREISEEQARKEIAPSVDEGEIVTLREQLEETARILVERITTGEHTPEERLVAIKAEVPALRDILNDLDKARGFGRAPISDDDPPDSVDPKDLPTEDEDEGH